MTSGHIFLFFVRKRYERFCFLCILIIYIRNLEIIGIDISDKMIHSSVSQSYYYTTTYYCTVLSHPDTLRHWYQETSCVFVSGSFGTHNRFTLLFFQFVCRLLCCRRQLYIVYNIERKQIGNLSERRMINEDTRVI